jgi:hypothetical protein
LLNQNNAKKKETLRLVFKPNRLGQRTGTGADAIGQLVGTKKTMVPMPITKVDQNEATERLADNAPS